MKLYEITNDNPLKMKLDEHVAKFSKDPNVEVRVIHSINELEQAWFTEKLREQDYTHYQEIRYVFVQTPESMLADPKLQKMIMDDYDGDARECSEDSKTGWEIAYGEEAGIIVPGWDSTEYQEKFWDVPGFEDLS